MPEQARGVAVEVTLDGAHLRVDARPARLVSLLRGDGDEPVVTARPAGGDTHTEALPAPARQATFRVRDDLTVEATRAADFVALAEESGRCVVVAFRGEVTVVPGGADRFALGAREALVVPAGKGEPRVVPIDAMTEADRGEVDALLDAAAAEALAAPPRPETTAPPTEPAPEPVPTAPPAVPPATAAEPPKAAEPAKAGAPAKAAAGAAAGAGAGGAGGQHRKKGKKGRPQPARPQKAAASTPKKATPAKPAAGGAAGGGAGTPAGGGGGSGGGGGGRGGSGGGGGGRGGPGGGGGGRGGPGDGGGGRGGPGGGGGGRGGAGGGRGGPGGGRGGRGGTGDEAFEERSSNRRVLVGAALALVVAVALVFLLTSGGDDDAEVSTGDTTTTESTGDTTTTAADTTTTAAPATTTTTPPTTTTARATTTTAAAPRPDYAITPKSCVQNGNSVTYTASVTNNAAVPFDFTVTVVFKDAGGDELATAKATVTKLASKRTADFSATGTSSRNLAGTGASCHVTDTVAEASD